MAPADTKRIRPVTYSPPFHLAIPVDDLAAADQFYHGLLGCPHGRRSDKWIDYDFFGHQLVAHLSPADCAAARTNVVDGHDVPARHFGVVIAPKDWRALGDRLQKAGADFIIEPNIRFKGEPGEQSEEHTSELQSQSNLVCRLLLEQ